VVECLQECAAYAAERGVLLALENHGGLTGTADQTLALLKAVDSEWLGLPNSSTKAWKAARKWTTGASAL
jgi:sugar phosphate isomerase/epimerase